MSQTKVEQYKKEKASHKEAIAREKRELMLFKVCGGAIVAILAVWIGFSTVDLIKNSRPVETIYCQTDAIDEYLNGLYAEETTESTETTEVTE